MLKVLVCGSREWQNVDIIRRELLALPRGSTVVHGDCRGADRLAGMIAESLGMTVRAYPAQWGLHGVAAGPIRNREMLEKEKPDLVLAFHRDLANSKGTADMISRARRAGVPVRVIEK